MVIEYFTVGLLGGTFLGILGLFFYYVIKGKLRK